MKTFGKYSLDKIIVVLKKLTVFKNFIRIYTH